MSDVMERSKTIELRVLRYRPVSDAEPVFETFQVPYSDDMSVLQALQSIKDSQDGTLSFRWSCRMAVCGSCGMMINGDPKLACETFLRDLAPNPVVIEPLRNFPIERDLVVTVGDFVKKIESIYPYIMPKAPRSVEEGAWLQTPAQMAAYESFADCINCMLCYAACPQFGANPHFIGPGAMALLQRYNSDSRYRTAHTAGPGVGRGRGVVVHGGRRLFRCVSETGRSGQRGQSEQDQQRGRLLLAPAAPEGRAMSERRPYLRAQDPYWWARKPYLGYTLRELTGVAVALYGAILLAGLICLCRGKDSFDAYRRILSGDVSLLVHLLLLVAVVWHVVTWFQTMPKTMPKLIVGGRQVPQQRMTVIGVALAALCSAALLAAVVMVGRWS